MFSVSDIKEETYPAAYRRGKELYETGGVWDFSYDIYLEREQTMAEIAATVRGNEQPSYPVTVVVDEAFATVSNAKCCCEAFYNYDRMCKHCVAALLVYVNRRQAKDILKAKNGDPYSAQNDTADEKKRVDVQMMKTDAAFKNLLNQYSLRAGVTYLLPESIYGKVEIEPYFKLDYSYATLEFKIGIDKNRGKIYEYE